MNLILNPIILFHLLLSLCQQIEDRIINGSDVNPPFKYPWMATIMRYNEYNCGGILITNDHVLTAAHCMGGNKAPLNNFEVQLHRQDLKKKWTEENGKVFSIQSRVIHTSYDEVNFYNDIAILKLNTSANLSPQIQLDDQLTHEGGKISTVLGWGSISPRGPTNPILQEVDLPLYNDKECAEAYAVNRYQIKPEIQLCAGFKEGGKDACSGDSGGPIFSLINNQPTLLGIVSNGNSTCGTKNSPGIYTRVSKYKGWIIENISK